MILAELVKTRPCSYLQSLCVVLAVTLVGLVQAQDYDNDNYYNNYGEDNYNNYVIVQKIITTTTTITTIITITTTKTITKILHLIVPPQVITLMML